MWYRYRIELVRVCCSAWGRRRDRDIDTGPMLYSMELQEVFIHEACRDRIKPSMAKSIVVHRDLVIKDLI